MALYVVSFQCFSAGIKYQFIFSLSICNMLSDVVLYHVKTNIGTYLVNGSSESDVRSLMVMNGYYVITCEKVLIKANEILPIDLI